MANGLYTNFKDGLMNQQYDLYDDTLNVAILDNTYTVDLFADTTYSASGAQLAEIATGVLAGASINGGDFDAADHTFVAVTAGNTVTQMVIYHNVTGDLIAYFNEDSSGAINVVTNGANITINWNVVAIFAL